MIRSKLIPGDAVSTLDSASVYVWPNTGFMPNEAIRLEWRDFLLVMVLDGDVCMCMCSRLNQVVYASLHVLMGSTTRVTGCTPSSDMVVSGDEPS